MQRKLFAIAIFILCLRYVVFFLTYQPLPDGAFRITGKIAEEPNFYEKSQRIIVKGYTIYIPLHPSLSMDDSVVVEGDAKEGVIQKGKLITFSSSTNPLFIFRKTLLDFYAKVLPQNIAELVAGAVLGSKQLLTTEFWNSLTATGTAHVVVASGMNVTIISKFILDLLLFIFPRKKAVPVAVTFIWLYALLAGLGAPIIRAAIMGSLTFTGQEFGKLSNPIRIFFITCFLMLFAKPEWLWDVSFLLTSTATFSIMVFQKPIEKKLQRVPTILREDLTTSLAASLGVTLILWWNFGQLTLFAPFINAIVLWTIAPITIIGGIGGIIGILIPTFGKALLYLIYPFAWWFTFVVDTFS